MEYPTIKRGELNNSISTYYSLERDRKERLSKAITEYESLVGHARNQAERMRIFENVSWKYDLAENYFIKFVSL